MMLCHTGGISSPSDFEANIEALERLASDAARTPSRRVVLMVIVETGNPPDAKTRKRLADASKGVSRADVAFVIQSRAVFFVFTALRWLIPQSSPKNSTVHPTYVAARDWLVSRRNHSADVYDRLYETLGLAAPEKNGGRRPDAPASNVQRG